MGRLTDSIRPYWLFLPLCAGVFVAADDQTVIVTVLPEVMSDLRVGPGDLDRASWAITGYLIGFTAAMPFMGRVADRIGFRNAYLAALAVFMIGSALVALSPRFPGWLYGGEPEFNWMVGARVFQAIGGGAIIPITLAAAGELVDGKHRAIAYGLVGASAEAGGVIGPLWGGVITETLSWEWAFWLNIPPVLIVAGLIARLPWGARHQMRIDVAGAGLFAVALTLVTLALVRIGEPDGLLAVFAIAATASVAALVWRNVSAGDPLFPRVLFRLLNFTSANAAHFLIGAALIIGMVTVPLMAGTVYDASPLEGGLRLLRMTIAIGVGALIGGVITQRIGPRAPALAGLAFAAVGFALMSRWTIDLGDPAMTVHLAITGLGFGLLVSPVAEGALHNVTGEIRGAGSALLTVSRMVGMTAGLAAMTGLGTVRFAELVADVPPFSINPEVQEQITEATTSAGLTVFNDFFVWAAVICAIAVVPVLVMTRRAAQRGINSAPAADV